jgi:DNA-binding CsgD family transcriptional regulator
MPSLRPVGARGEASYDRVVPDSTAANAGLPAQRPLSIREAEVLELLSFGLRNGEIAARLGVSIAAVKFHLASIYRKLGVGNRTQAASVYLRGAAR